MTMISHVDWLSKRLYLHADTVTQGFDAVDGHFEVLELIAANLNNEQNYICPTIYEGNLAKGGGRFTSRYVIYRDGWRPVPYGLVSHELRVLVEMLSYEGLSDRALFDRSSVAPSVFIDITPAYEKIEIREVATGGLTNNQAVMLMELWQRQGLDSANILEITDSLIRTGNIQISINQSLNSTELVRV